MQPQAKQPCNSQTDKVGLGELRAKPGPSNPNLYLLYELVNFSLAFSRLHGMADRHSVPGQRDPLTERGWGFPVQPWHSRFSFQNGKRNWAPLQSFLEIILVFIVQANPRNSTASAAYKLVKASFWVSL